MSISDTQAAKKYASIAEVAAAQTQAAYQEALKAPDYANEALTYRDEAETFSDNASQAASNAASSQVQALQSVSNASDFAQAASVQADASASSALSSATSATLAQQANESAQSEAESALASANNASSAAFDQVQVVRSDLLSGDAGKGSTLITNTPSFPTAQPRFVDAKFKDFPTIYDWNSDSLNDDTTRFTKAVADGVQYVDLTQASLKVANLVVNKAIRFDGRGKQGLSGVGTQIIVDPDADFGISFDSTGFTRPTGGGLSNASLKCAVRNTGDPDLLKVTSWSYFGINEVEFANSQGWMIRLKDCMESQILNFNMRAFGSETTGGILLDDYISASYNNVNNLHISHGTFGGGSGPWISSTSQSNPDLIWIDNIKFEWDAILSSANTTNKYVIDFLNMARCWIDRCGFTHLADINNMYQAALHMGPLCGFSTEFNNNKLYGMRAPWFVEGGSLFARDNTSNQADYTSSSNMGGVITSNKVCDVEPVKHVTSNGSLTRGKLPRDPGYTIAHDLGGNINNAFVVDSSATQSTAMVVATATQIRILPLPASVLDGTSVVNLTIRVRCQDVSGANSTLAVIAGSTTLSSKTIVAATGWQLIKVQLKPSQLTTSSLSLTNTGSVSIIFDGVKVEKSSYIDWNFAFSPGAIAAGAVVTSPIQSFTDTIGTSALIQSISQARFDASSTGLLSSINTIDANGSFTLSLYNPTASTVTPAITRAFVRLFLN